MKPGLILIGADCDYWILLPRSPCIRRIAREESLTLRSSLRQQRVYRFARRHEAFVIAWTSSLRRRWYCEHLSLLHPSCAQSQLALRGDAIAIVVATALLPLLRPSCAQSIAVGVAQSYYRYYCCCFFIMGEASRLTHTRHTDHQQQSNHKK